MSNCFSFVVFRRESALGLDLFFFFDTIFLRSLVKKSFVVHLFK